MEFARMTFSFPPEMVGYLWNLEALRGSVQVFLDDSCSEDAYLQMVMAMGDVDRELDNLRLPYGRKAEKEAEKEQAQGRP